MIITVFEVGRSSQMTIDHSLDGNRESYPHRLTAVPGSSAFDQEGKPARQLSHQLSMEADQFKLSNWPGAYSGDPVRVTELAAGGFAVAVGSVEIHIVIDSIARAQITDKRPGAA